MRAPPEPDVADPIAFAAAARDRGVIGMVREALDRGRVMLAFQPVVSAATGAVAFHEGLVRVLDPTGRIIPAAQFVAVVEAQELGRLVDCAALRCGLGALRRNPGLRLSVNMSARSIGYPRWTATLNRGLKADPSAGERLILEINEDSAMRVPELVGGLISDLRGRGVSFALDDFGAGRSELRHLAGLLFDIVKIDGAFVRGCDTDADSRCMLEGIAALGRSLGMATVAERVETRAEADFAARAGVDCLQGYLYGAPEVRPVWLRGGPGEDRASA
ncbi:EAL domain-containing protein [Jannaschia sp. W003]|uniref:EAL domain-containing protein n=1 Tax=Jannaschia sp. W003 TaxID=2867012 RepID=UPI0021A64600|nr:EAL domain-containing protein [Jannaschia sp. W003]UWQ22874.1 EAL domain-containing protein [Jannaschia sp. W003]